MAGTAASALAGCASNAANCDDANRSDVEAEKAIPPKDVREAVVPIRFEDLPSDEQDVAAKAIRGDSYAECSPESEAFESFLSRIAEHRDRQQLDSEADLTTVYLMRVRTYYALEATKLDRRVSY